MTFGTGYGNSGAPQAQVDYGGLWPYIMSASMTLTPGLSPSVCTIRLNALPFIPPSSQPLQFFYGNFAWSFSRCKIENFSVEFTGDGQIYTAEIYDRRWMWADRGKVSGQYNVYVNSRIQPETERSAEDLIKLCLEELGETETTYTIILTPDQQQIRPEVDWDFDRPANALSSLLDELGLLCCLGPVDDRIYIVPRDFQATLLDNVDATAFDQQADPPDPPAQITIVSNRVKFQADFLLEPVMMDYDGNWYPAEEVSYAPVAPVDGLPKWLLRDPTASDIWEYRRASNPSPPPDDISVPVFEDDSVRKLVSQYLFRAYRVVPNKIVSWEDPYNVMDAHIFDPAFGKLRNVSTEVVTTGDVFPGALLPGMDIPVASWRDIEVLDSMAEVKPFRPNGNSASDVFLNRQKPAIVWGTWHDTSGISDYPSNRKTQNPALVFEEPAIRGSDREGGDPHGWYEGGFSIDSKTAIVFFSQPICEEIVWIEDNNYPGMIGFYDGSYTVPAGQHVTGGFIACRKLFLRTAIHARFNGEWARIRYSVTPPQAANPAPPWSVRYEIKDDLEPFFHVNRLDPVGEPISNLEGPVTGAIGETSIRERAEYYWREIEKEYRTKTAFSVTKIGLLPFGNDGEVKQVTWNINEDGSASTRISKNREEFHLSLGFEERKQLEARRKDRWDRQKISAQIRQDARKAAPREPLF